MAGIRTQYTQFVIVLVMKRRLHDIWFDYQSEFYFGIILSVLLVLSAWLSRYIPEEVFDEYINPAMSVAFAAICFYGAVLCFIHHKGVAARRLWATILITMGVWEIVLLVLTNTLTPTIMRVGTTTFSSLTIVVACVFGWLLLLYPTEVPDKAMLEEWMDAEKPYRNPDFQLQDLQQVLPLNRTYLSRFINAEYDCSFYQLVTRYRVEEAKRLLHEYPQMKIQEISEQCGFSSPTIFTRVFTRETGLNPSEWK